MSGECQGQVEQDLGARVRVVVVMTSMGSRAGRWWRRRRTARSGVLAATRVISRVASLLAASGQARAVWRSSGPPGAGSA